MDEKTIGNQEQGQTKNEGQTPDATPKPKFGEKVKSFFSRNKKKFIIGGLAAAGIAAGALVKNHRDKVRDAEAEDEAARAELAEEWYNRGLAAGQGALPEPESEVADDANEEES